MTKIHFFTQNTVPTSFDDDTRYFEMFSNKSKRAISVGLPFMTDLRRFGIVPTVPALDFVTFALSIVTSDRAVSRAATTDGWTRKIELTIPINKADAWLANKGQLEKMLRYLTGDFWSLHFLSTGSQIKDLQNKAAKINKSCVCLLSGGIDSLVGAIDLVSDGVSPLFVSQIVRGDAASQKIFADTLGTDSLFQWSAGRLPSEEGSTRARSIMFFAYAALSACSLNEERGRTQVFVPENGFISLNIPLDANRIGSLSTKTTHPIYIKMLQEIWDAIGMNAELVVPYKYKTKGEILRECKNQLLLKRLVFASNSCGKYQRNKLQQCGVCVPCLVRRAAFLESGLHDDTVRGYVHEDLKLSGYHEADTAAVAMAVKQVEAQGVEQFVKSNLSFANGEERAKLLGVVSRGIIELGELLRSKGVL